MKKKINNKLIRSFDSCYNPTEVGIPDNESLTIKNWIIKYRTIVKNPKDILWLLLRNEFMLDKDLRLFACWCAREALKLVNNPDERSINSINVAERFANGLATIEELRIAYDAAANAANAADDAAKYANTAANAAADAAAYAAYNAAYAAANYAANAAANAAYYAAANAYAAADNAVNTQIDQLLTHF